MAHFLYVAKSGYGKTTLARANCKGMRRHNVLTAVLDPLPGAQGRWAADFITGDFAAFSHFLETHVSVCAFVDEPSLCLDKNDTSQHWLTTASRHRGHSLHLLCQRTQQYHPNIRENISQLFLFETTEDSLRWVANEFRVPEVITPRRMPVGEFFYIGGKPDYVQRCRLDIRTGTVKRITSPISMRN